MNEQAGQKAAAPVATANAPGQSDAASLSDSAAQSVPLFGGLRGGRKREDGLVPGSAEALAADKERDRLRKASERSAVKATAPLPSRLAPDANAVQTTAGVAVAGAVAQVGEIIPWDSQMLNAPFSELMQLTERLDVESVIDQAKEAKLPPELIKEISKDAQWPALSKRSLEMSGPPLVAKWLNKFGISAKNKEEVFFIGAITSIVVARKRISSRLDTLIQQRKEAADSAKADADAKK